MSEAINAASIRVILEKHWKPRPQRKCSDEQCRSLASAAKVVRDRRPPPRPPQPEAVSHGRRFLNKADEMRATLNREMATYYYIEIQQDGTERLHLLDEDRYERCKLAITELEQAERAMSRALQTWKDREFLFIDDRDPTIFLAHRVQLAWELSEAEVPQSINEDDPLCKCVADLLELAGIRVGQGKTKGEAYSSDAVSAVLKEKNKGLNFIRTS
jgi:hypothetical protein